MLVQKAQLVFEHVQVFLLEKLHLQFLVVHHFSGETVLLLDLVLANRRLGTLSCSAFRPNTRQLRKVTETGVIGEAVLA